MDIDGLEGNNDTGPQASGGAKGGGDAKASDGTGATDKKGRDVIHGVETERDKRGNIFVFTEKGGRELAETSYNITGEQRKAIQNHWNEKPVQNISPSTTQPATGDSKNTDPGDKGNSSGSNGNSPKGKKNNSNNGSSGGNNNNGNNKNNNGNNKNQPPPNNNSEAFKIEEKDVFDFIEHGVHDSLEKDKRKAIEQLDSAAKKALLKKRLTNSVAYIARQLESIEKALNGVKIFSYVKDAITAIISGIDAFFERTLEKVRQFVDDIFEPILEFALSASLKFDYLVDLAKVVIKRIPGYDSIFNFISKVILSYLK